MSEVSSEVDVHNLKCFSGVGVGFIFRIWVEVLVFCVFLMSFSVN